MYVYTRFLNINVLICEAVFVVSGSLKCVVFYIDLESNS